VGSEKKRKLPQENENTKVMEEYLGLEDWR
jgi:hypothetical protein